MSDSRRVALIAGSFVTFAGASLLFSLQPLVGKIVLPRFGGSAAVWSVCLVFFQSALLGGYALAFGLARLRPKQQAISFACFALLAAVSSSIPMGDAWRLTWFENPAGELLLKLTRYVALPCVLLSSVSVLVQIWSRLAGVRDPYAFYALSNFGSLGALLAYPTVIEPQVSVHTSAAIWTWAFRIVAIALAAFPFLIRIDNSDETQADDASQTAPTFARMLIWMCFAAVGSGLLVSFSSRITQDIAAIPMLWVIPLSLYLLTFVICFSHRGVYQRAIVAPLVLAAFAVHTFLSLRYEWSALGFSWRFAGLQTGAGGATVGIVISATTFFLLVLLLHGELYSLRPAPRYLSRFYLGVAAGGACGGMFVSLVAPHIFKVEIEYLILLGFVCGVLLWVTIKHRAQLLQSYSLNLALTIAVIVLGLSRIATKMIGPQSLKGPDTAITYYRNVYGPMRIEETPRQRTFLHAGTVHGNQLTAEEDELRPISYFSEQSGFGVVYSLFAAEPRERPLKIGVIGLGVGTIAAYSGPDCSITFYEIDPEVANIARRHFTYLPKARGQIAMSFGDGRTTLETEPPQEFDILLVDAFTGDGVPIHLLTREALELYQRHLKADGAMLFQITNDYVRLEPVIANAARALGLHALRIQNDPEGAGLDYSDYAVVSARALPLVTKTWEDLGLTIVTPATEDPALRVWTDDYSNLFSVLRRN